MKKTKIICTIGPASNNAALLSRMAEAGMNVVRLNFSHGTHNDHLKVIEYIKDLRKKSGINIGILQDLSGPKIRVGSLPDHGIVLEKNTVVYFYHGADYFIDSNSAVIPVNYPHLLKDVNEKSTILLDDGLLELAIEKKDKNRLRARVIRGGVLKSHKGINFPNQILSQRIPTTKDLEDLAFGIKHEVDFVALSFVQTADDIRCVKQKIRAKKSKAQIIAKLERQVALKNVDEIIAAADGIMVARGDLGIETDISMIPIHQKMIVRKCNLQSKPVIIATQMLDSMMRNPIPTRAEVTDVANAIYDGSDAIMLSGETAVGKYPLQTVQMMNKIADNVEHNLGLDRGWIIDSGNHIKHGEETAIAQAVCQSAKDLKAKFIVVHTMSGQTARFISMFRPETPILAVTPLESTYRQLSLIWGITPILLPEIKYHFMDIIKSTEAVLLKTRYVKIGDLLVISTGLPTAKPGATNLMKIHTVGDIQKS
ncbi:MAG: pyruvate kinase [Spirochaetales bacterium]|nr:pyruvate kinase [Spirochaetales bacterium]